MSYTVADVTARIQAYVADSLGDWTDASVLNPFVFAAYRDVVRLLRAAGVTMFRRTSDPITLASGITTIGRAAGVSPISPTPFPADLVRPVELVEKVSGGTYVRMAQSSGVLEDRTATTRLEEWDWKYDQITFPAASGSVTVKIEYEAVLTDLTGSSSVIAIPDGDDAVTYLAAARALRSRGGQDDLAASLETAAQQAIAATAASELASRTSTSGRWGTQDQTTATSVQAVLRLAGPLANRALQGQTGLSDWDLLPFVRVAYRTVARSLRAAGVSLFRRKTPSAIVVTTGVKAIGRATTPALPSDLLRPLELMERPNSSSVKYRRMAQSEGLMEDRLTDSYLQEWEWKDDTIRFVGAGGDVDLLIEYEAVLPELLTPNDPILIPDAVDAIAGLAAAYAVTGRQNVTGGDALAAEARKAVDDLVASELMLKAAMGGRWGPQDQSTTQFYISVASVLRIAGALVNQKPDRRALTDAALLPFVRAAYADIVAALRVERCQYFQKTIVITGVPNTNTSLGPSTSPALPSDFMRPLYIREQWALHDGAGYTPMQPVSLTAVDDEQVYNNYRGYYKWANGTLYFPKTGVRPVPPNTPYDTDFEIVYEFQPAPLNGPNDSIAIPGSASAVATLAAAYVFMSRGDDASQLRKEADVLIARLVQADKISRETAAGQFGPKRPPTS